MDIITLIIVAVGILQLPLLIDILRNFFPNLTIKRLTQDYASYTLFLLIITIYFCFMWLFFSSFIYVKEVNPYYTLKGWLLIVTACYLCIISFFHYAYATFHDPGTAPLATTAAMADYDICQKCNRIKIQSTRHCKVCQRCICMMDHHCPFTFNCVGLNNFYYFVSFLGFTWLGMCYAIYITYDAFMGCMIGRSVSKALLPDGSCIMLGKNAIVFVPIFTLWLALGTLLCFQIFCLFCNLSSLDFSLSFRQAKVLRTAWHKLRAMELLNKNSRMQILYLKRRKHFWQHVLPIPIKDL